MDAFVGQTTENCCTDEAGPLKFEVELAPVAGAKFAATRQLQTMSSAPLLRLSIAAGV